MTIIALNRRLNILRIGEHNGDLKRYVNITVIYDVSHVTNLGDGWYDIYRGKTRLGHITDVEYVKEEW